MAKKQKKKINIMGGRVSYPHFAKPDQYDANAVPKYKCTLIFDKKEDLAAAEALVKEAMAEHSVKRLKDPVVYEGRDDKDEQKGKFCITPRTQYEPAYWDENNVRLTKEEAAEKIYAGCYANAQISMFKHAAGISACLHQVQFARDGEPLKMKESCAFGEETAREDDGFPS